jgi:hypothetical protein
LDSVGNPVYAKENTVIELVSNNQAVLKTPNQIIIKEGEYFNTFELESLTSGTAELAILSQDLPLSKYDVTVIELVPVLSLTMGGGLSWNERIESKLSLTIPQIEASLSGFNVEWTTEGGEVRSIEEVTNNEGVAILNIIANDKDSVSISATVSGNGLDSASISKTVKILNMPVVIDNSVSETGKESSPLNGLNLDSTTIILIVIPIAIAAALLFLKRTDRLELITDKIPLGDLDIGDRFEGIKEKISDIKNR